VLKDWWPWVVLKGLVAIGCGRGWLAIGCAQGRVTIGCAQRNGGNRLCSRIGGHGLCSKKWWPWVVLKEMVAIGCAEK
jgi:hypothetical protein